MNTPKMSRNKALVKKRCLRNLVKATRKAVEILDLPILSFYVHTGSKKLEVIGDNESIDEVTMDNTVMNKIVQILTINYRTGEKHYANYKEECTKQGQENPNKAEHITVRPFPTK